MAGESGPFGDFMRRREAISTAYINGSAEG